LARRRPRSIGISLLAKDQLVEPVLLGSEQLQLAGPLLCVDLFG